MNQITAYQTDRAGLFLCETMADESPLEPGVFLIPAGAVEQPPPSEWPDDKWPRWNGYAWDLIAKPSADETAKIKLAAFLARNPDVLGLISTGSTSAIANQP